MVKLFLWFLGLICFSVGLVVVIEHFGPSADCNKKGGVYVKGICLKKDAIFK